MPQKIPFSRAGPNKVLFPYLEKLKSARTRPNYPLVLVAELNRPEVRSQRALEIVPLNKAWYLLLLLGTIFGGGILLPSFFYPWASTNTLKSWLFLGTLKAPLVGPFKFIGPSTPLAGYCPPH